MKDVSTLQKELDHSQQLINELETKLKQAKKELQEGNGIKKEGNVFVDQNDNYSAKSEACFRLAIEAARLGAFDWDFFNQTFYSSPRLIQLFGLSGLHATHQQLTSSIHPDDLPVHEKNIAASQKSGILRYEIRVIHPDNSTHWVRITGKIDYEQNHQPKRAYGTAMDITEQKEAEFVLKEDARKIRSILESIPQMAWTAYPNGTINYFTKSWYEYTGLTEEKELTKLWSSAWHPECVAQAETHWLESIKNNTPFETECLVKRASDTTYRWMSVKAVPLKNSEGDVLFWIGSITDIHEQKTFAENLEQKIQERTKQLKQSQYDLAELNNTLAEKNFELEKQNIELSSFSYITSHDLQEPIRKIHTFSQLLMEREKDKLSPSATDYLRRISISSMRMKQLVDAFLDYSRIEDTITKVVSTNLNSILQEAINTLSDTIEDKNATIEYQELPTILGVPIQLHQLFINLISNSIKYSKKEIAPHIQINVKKIDQEETKSASITSINSFWKIDINDNGIGFEQKHAAKIFDVFYRLHNKYEYEGTGIGLSICKKIVHAHRGYIIADGIPGKGSNFTIYFPVTP